MKPVLRLTMAACGLALLNFLVATGQAQDYTYETNNGTINITGYTGPGGAVIIPGTINGLPVTNIGNQSFLGCSSLTSIAIPNSVTSIGTYAFSSCTSLTNVILPDSVTSIGERGFGGCTGLTSIVIPNGVTNMGPYLFESCSGLTNAVILARVVAIPGGMFASCRSLLSVTLPEGVTSFDRTSSVFSLYPIGPFYGCDSLAGILIPNSVTNIAGGAFAYCRSLTNVTIPDRVTSIGAFAFFTCSSLTSIPIPDSVTTIAGGAFHDCAKLTGIYVGPLNPSYSSLDGVLFNKGQTRLIQYPDGKAGSYTVPNSVTTIGDWAFSGCTSLTSVIIPNSVTTIGDWAFSGCTSLTSVTIGNGVTSIGNHAFDNCENLVGAFFHGNSPSDVGQDVFAISPTWVYYLPGTTGWFSTFDWCPTALWLLPHAYILTTAPAFGVQPNGFGFRISWATNASVVVEASTSLSGQDWSPVATNTLTDGWSDFSDAGWTNYPGRFYRVRQW